MMNRTDTVLLLLWLVVATVSSLSIESRKLIVAARQPWIAISSRGGSSIIDLDDESEEESDDESNAVQEEEVEETVDEDMDDEEEEESEDDDEESEDEDDDEGEEKAAPSASAAPVSIIFKTNLGSPLIDTKLELLCSRTRNIDSIKNTLSRMLPGRPPAPMLRILSDGMVLDDDQLIDDIVEEDDDDDDEEEEAMVLTLDMVPPVNPKFATELGAVSDMSTSDLLDAYTANAAAMYHNGHAIFSGDDEEEESMLSVRLRHEAHDIRQQLEDGFSEKSLKLLESDSAPSTEMVDERRGQRYRTSKGGARTNLKRTIQTNLNIVSIYCVY